MGHIVLEHSISLYILVNERRLQRRASDVRSEKGLA